MAGAVSATAAAAAGWTRECAIRWAEPRMLSSITMTVTVAPLMMSSFWPAGAGCQHVLAREPGDQGLDLLGRNADQDDRLVMLDQLGAGDHAVRIDPDRDPDRLARVADSVDHVRVEEHPAFQLGAGIGRGSRWDALDRAQPIGARDQRGHRELRQEPPELRLGGPSDAGRSGQQDRGQDQRARSGEQRSSRSGKEARRLFHPDFARRVTSL